MSAGRARRVAWWLVIVALMVATLAAASVGGWQLVIKSRELPPVADQPAARQEATQAASIGTVKLLSYSPDTLDEDFSAASAMLVGDFLKYYKQFTNDVVRPAALQKQLKTSAAIKRAGVESLTRDAAAILVFVDQTTTSTEKSEPTKVSSSVRVGLARVNGTWLINRFDPV